MSKGINRKESGNMEHREEEVFETTVGETVDSDSVTLRLKLVGDPNEEIKQLECTMGTTIGEVKELSLKRLGLPPDAFRHQKIIYDGKNLGDSGVRLQDVLEQTDAQPLFHVIDSAKKKGFQRCVDTENRDLIKVQARIRGFITRKHLMQLKDKPSLAGENHFIIKVQSIWRGFYTRKSFKYIKEDKVFNQQRFDELIAITSVPAAFVEETVEMPKDKCVKQEESNNNSKEQGTTFERDIPAAPIRDVVSNESQSFRLDDIGLPAAENVPCQSFDEDEEISHEGGDEIEKEANCSKGAITRLDPPPRPPRPFNSAESFNSQKTEDRSISSGEGDSLRELDEDSEDSSFFLYESFKDLKEAKTEIVNNVNVKSNVSSRNNSLHSSIDFGKYKYVTDRRFNAYKRPRSFLRPPKNYVQDIQSIKDRETLHILFQKIYNDVKPVRDCSLLHLEKDFVHKKSPLKPALIESNRPLVFGPERQFTSPTKAENLSTEHKLRNFRRHAEEAACTMKKREDYIQRLEYDDCIAEEVSSTLLLARQQKMLHVTTPAESVGYWISTEGWDALFAAFNADRGNARSLNGADDIFMKVVREQASHNGMLNSELIRQYLNFILSCRRPSPELSSKLKKLPFQDEMKTRCAHSLGQVVASFRRIFLSYYDDRLFNEIGEDFDLHQLVVEDALLDLFEFQESLKKVIVWRYPVLSFCDVRNPKAEIGRLKLDDSRGGSYFRIPQTACDIVSLCIEDAVINPLMDNIYLFYFPILNKEDRCIYEFCREKENHSRLSATFLGEGLFANTSVITNARNFLEGLYQQRTPSGKFKCLTDCIQVLIYSREERLTEDQLASTFLVVVVTSIPFNLSTQSRFLHDMFSERHFNIQTKYALALLETTKIAILDMAIQEK